MGLGTMMCYLLTRKLSPEVLSQALNKVFIEARRTKQPYIYIFFAGLDIKTAFEDYRDSFTQSIDIGVRLFIESDLDKVKEILSKHCQTLYIHKDDHDAKRVAEELNILSVIIE